MHAVIGIFKMDPAFYDQQLQALNTMIIPMVKSQPGFRHGYWSYDRPGAKSYSYILVESEEAARKFAGMVKENNSRPNPFGVALESLTIVELIGEARS
jgi:hypothetical protein